MIKKYTVLGIIPARGGSKRVPKKNIKKLVGKPLISYTFDEAKKSKYIDRLVLISDDKKIGALAKKNGVDWPFVEPPDMADGTKTDFEFFTHMLQWLKDNESYVPDIIVQLRPTSPLRTVEHIDKCIELLADHPEADSVRTVTEPEQSPYKMFKIESGGYLSPLLLIPGIPESYNLPQAKLPKAYKHVGYLDIIWNKTIMEKKKMTGEKVLAFPLEVAYSGINTISDWEYYEYLIKKQKKNSKNKK